MFGINAFLPNFLQPLFILKVGFLALIAIFIVFSIILSNQVATMNKSLSQKQASGPLHAFSILIALLTISLFLIALVIL
jgi:hypothetical protein